MENIPAGYWLILCNLIFTDPLPVPAPFGGRFPVSFCFAQFYIIVCVHPLIVAEFSLC
jgi:hypothetical protein